MAALRLNYGRSNPVTAAAAASTTRLVYNFIQSLTLIPTQTITHTTHTPRTATTATNTTTAGATSSSSISFIPSLLNSLRDLLPPWLLAVPKSKTTHSKKAMRNSNKGLKEQQGIVSCPACGTPKRSHHLCHICLVSYRKEFHAEAKAEKLAAKTSAGLVAI